MNSQRIAQSWSVIGACTLRRQASGGALCHRSAAGSVRPLSTRMDRAVPDRSTHREDGFDFQNAFACVLFVSYGLCRGITSHVGRWGRRLFWKTPLHQVLLGRRCFAGKATPAARTGGPSIGKIARAPRRLELAPWRGQDERSSLGDLRKLSGCIKQPLLR